MLHALCQEAVCRASCHAVCRRSKGAAVRHATQQESDDLLHEAPHLLLPCSMSSQEPELTNRYTASLVSTHCTHHMQDTCSDSIS